MLVKEVEGLLKKGLEALAQGDTLSALSYFEKAINIENSPIISSYYAFCIAKERGQVIRAISLCEEAIKREPKNSLHYLNLGRIYLITNNKEDAIKTFREGLNYEANQQIVDELSRLEIRKPPIIKFLKRNNPINRYLGIILRSKKWLRMFYILLSLLLAVVASILLILFLPEKQKIPPQSSEVKKGNFVEAEHATLYTPELIAKDTTGIFVNIDGGEVLKSGSTHTITWTTHDTVGPKVKILYTDDEGATWRVIVTLPGNPGSYDWTVPTVTKTKTKCKVKVVLKDSSGNTAGSYTSERYFTIQPQCFNNIDCSSGFYCKKPEGSRDSGGVCAEKPRCIAFHNPVCGHDGKTYRNECEAAEASVSVAYQGECFPW